MEIKNIEIINANVHNLKGVGIKIPKNTLTVITGPSGSGKSSLAFDTIYVEGQRRYIESLSSYARQFLGQFQPPDVESITGLSPAIAIDQKTVSKNPRSTVGTITEIYDYLRVLYARVGDLYCPESGELVQRHGPPQIVNEIQKLKEKTKIHVLAPITFQSTKELKGEISKFQAMGFNRMMVDEEVLLLDEIKVTSKIEKAFIVVDRLVLKEGVEKRLTDSVEYALKLGHGIISFLIGEKKVQTYSEHNMAPKSEIIYPDLEPRLFSFNSPLGACQDCNGLGQTKNFEKNLLLANLDLPLLKGSIPLLTKKNSFIFRMVENTAEQEGVDLSVPYNKLPKKFLTILWKGTKKNYTYSFTSENSHFEFKKPFPGLIEWFYKKFRETSSERVRKELENYMAVGICPTCNGERLNPVALSTLVGGKNIIEITSLSIRDAFKEIKAIKMKGEKAIISEKLLKEISSRLKFLNDVGLGYLTLNRSAMSLSGGEGQRIRLATQIGSALSGVLYVLDEPSIGLHQRDNNLLLGTLKNLRDLGNTVLVVEHDEETMTHADYIIDMGPGAGIHGGEIVTHGKLDKVLKSKKAITSQYLSGKKKIETPTERKELTHFIELKGATQNNVKNLNAKIPLEGIVCITGVSGSGKSTLLHEILVPAIKTKLFKKDAILYQKDNYESIKGTELIQSVIELDQTPIGRTPNSNPATYTGLFSFIRDLYGQTPESKIRGYKPGRFSFNVKGGRCEECEGNGVKKIEMHFLPDVYVTCSTCKGSRYNRETLSILYKGKSIADVLDFSIEEALDFFKNHNKARRILETLNDVGLGYMKLGQPATTLSGGEAQRLKLSRELSKKAKGHCLYILDEPTTGLHFEDIKILLAAIKKLGDQGHSIVIIEHNLDVIKTADYVIDLGPEGGDKGGTIVAQGKPEEVAKVKGSLTGGFLKKALKK